MAWFPWVLLWADQALRAPGGPGGRAAWWRPALLAGGALALQLLNGEPSTVVMSGLGVLALAASAAGRRPAAALRAAVPVLFAVALAAVQLLPTLGRLADSPRKDLSAAHATLWSMPPARLAEIVLPRFFGDPTRNLEGDYFGWRLKTATTRTSNRSIPASCSPSWGEPALIRWRIPRRAAWALAFLGGVFLALGRHNPCLRALRRAVPLLAVLRFPEKFAVLAVLGLVLAGVLGWQWLLDERRGGEVRGRPTCPSRWRAVALLTSLLSRSAPLAAPRRVLAGRRPWRARPRGPRHGRRGGLLRGEAGRRWQRRRRWSACSRSAAGRAPRGGCWRGWPSRCWRSTSGTTATASCSTLPATAYTVPPPLARRHPPRRGPGVRAAASPAARRRSWTARARGDPRTLIART